MKEALLAKIAELQWRIADLEKRLVVAESTNGLMVPVAKIIELVATRMGTNAHEIRSRHRSSREVLPRQIVMHLARKHTKLSFPTIGKCLERDHTTVMYGSKKIKKMIELDKELNKLVEGFSKEINDSGLVLPQPCQGQENPIS